MPRYVWFLRKEARKHSKTSILEAKVKKSFIIRIRYY